MLAAGAGVVDADAGFAAPPRVSGLSGAGALVPNES